MIPILITLPLVCLQVPANELSDRWKEHYTTMAAALELSIDDDGAQRLALDDKSILRYTNPERERGQHGAVYVWTYRGRPQVVGTVWSIRYRGDPTKRRTALELHSTSEHALHFTHPPDAIRKNGRVPKWKPSQPGVEFKALQETPKPASSSAGRLLQLKRLARRFSARMTAEDDSQQELRLLPRPIYRYQSKSAGVVDGAIFAMAMGTDPELLLMLELRGTDDKQTWHYAPVRFTGRPLQLSIDDKVIWRAEKAKTWNAEQPYLFCVGVDEVDAERPGKKR